MDIAVLGIDLGKNSCSVVGLDGSGKVVLRRRMQRKTIVGLVSKLSPCIIAMEACCGAHHLGRVFSAQAHTVRLMSPEYVRPYVKAQKNDDRDAEAIAEAATRPTMRFVALKSEEQLDMQTLHRARDQAVRERTSLMNQLRAVLLERGVIVPQGRARLRVRVNDILRQGTEALSSRIRLLIEEMLTRWQALDERISTFDSEFATEVEAERGCAPADQHSRDWRPQRNCPRRCRGRCGDLHARSRSRCLARACSSAGDDRRQASPPRYYQTRQQILAQDVDPGRSCSVADVEPRQHSARTVAARSTRESSFQYGSCCARRQDGAHRLGAPAVRYNL
jgi:transposase